MAHSNITFPHLKQDIMSDQNQVEQEIFKNYDIAASAALLLYDYLLTLESERCLIWPSRLTAVKITFIVNRYLPFITAGGMTSVIGLSHLTKDDHFCVLGTLFFDCLVFLGYTVAEFMLYIRAYALWGCKRRIAIILCLVFLVMLALETTFVSLFLRSVDAFDLSSAHTGCHIEYRNNVVWISVAVLMASETFILVCLLLRYRFLRGSNIVHMILTDGIIYYIFVLASSVVNIVLLLVLRTPSNFLITQGTLHSIFSSRLLLHIRGAYQSISITLRTITANTNTEVRTYNTPEIVSTFRAVPGLDTQGQDCIDFPSGDREEN